MKYLFYYQLINFIRKPNWALKIGQKFLFGILITLFFSQFIFLGYFLDIFLKAFNPDIIPIFFINKYLVYYFLFMMILRILYQRIDGCQVRPYLLMPLRKNILIHSILLKNLFSIFNFISILIFIPFAVKNIFSIYPFVNSICWLLTIILISFFINYLIVFFKQKFEKSLWLITVFPGMILLVSILRFFSLEQISHSIFGQSLKFSFSVLIPIILLGFMYFVNFKVIKNILYLDSNINRGKSYANSKFYTVSIRWKFLLLNVKLILRNKRPKGIIFSSLAFIFNSFIFIFLSNGSDSTFAKYFLLAGGTIYASGFIFHYLNFVLSLENAYFDFLRVKYNSINELFITKYVFSIIAAFFGVFLVSLFAFFISKKIVIYCLLAFIFNVGVFFPLLLYGSLFRQQKINIKESAFLNFNGIDFSIGQNLIQFFGTGLSIIVIGIAGIFNHLGLVYYILGGLGILGLLFFKKWFSIIEDRFNCKKYVITDTLRGT